MADFKMDGLFAGRLITAYLTAPSTTEDSPNDKQLKGLEAVYEMGRADEILNEKQAFIDDAFISMLSNHPLELAYELAEAAWVLREKRRLKTD